ncbi:MAG: HAD-IIIA family hydrolase [Muribaculaceae bacterium]
MPIEVLKRNITSFITVLQQLGGDTRHSQTISQCIKDLMECSRRMNKVIIFGDGGFAAVSQHIVAELMGRFKQKRSPIAAISLATDASLITCIANDFGFEKVFSRQICGLAKEGDVVIALSGSGQSKNILEGIAQAHRMGLSTYLFTGSHSATEAQELGVNVIHIPSTHTDQIQDAVMVIFHSMCSILEAEQVDNDTDHVWETVIAHGLSGKYRTLLLDRDGVVNQLLPNQYVTNISQAVITAGFCRYAAQLASAYERIFIVSNQACIGKGIADANQVASICQYIANEVAKLGGRIDGVYICGDANADSRERKPNIGLANAILRDYPDTDFAQAIVVGDSYSDKLFAQRIAALYYNIDNA